MHSVNRQNPIIVLSSDENYATYIPVLINSIQSTLNKNVQCKIYIFDVGITSETKFRIEQFSKSFANMSIKFINLVSQLKKFEKTFVTFAHFTIATYARFFIADIFPEYDKILYLDVDLLVLSDISELFDIDIERYLVAAAIDACYARQLYFNENNIVDYSLNILGLPEGISEFNAGVLLINLKKWRELNLTKICIDKLADIGVPRVLDQCVLNAVIPQDQIYHLPIEWNYLWHARLHNIANLDKKSKFAELVNSYEKIGKNKKIIHYTSSIKPWNYYFLDDAETKQVIGELAKEWWRFAIDTPFYGRILANKPNFNVLNYYIFGIKVLSIKKTEQSKEWRLLGLKIFYRRRRL